MNRLSLLLLLAVLSGPLAASASLPARADDDQAAARRAVEAGEIRPLDEVLAVARKAVPGDVVKLDLKREKGRWVYELKILDQAGKRREVEIDAKTLAVEDDDDD